MSENDNHVWRSLGNIEAKIDTIISVQAGIVKDGCALGQEHTRQITAILSKNGNGNGVKKSNGGNWIEVTKNGIRAGGITSLMMAILLWLAWNQYHNTKLTDPSRYVSRHEFQREIAAFTAAKDSAVRAADKIERGAQ